jgi:thymidylate synthase (FAD)
MKDTSNSSSCCDQNQSDTGGILEKDVVENTTYNGMYDVMSNVKLEQGNIGGGDNKGVVRLVDMMPRLVPVGKTADFAVLRAARVSYGNGTKQVSDDKTLLRYLLRHRHTSPFEMICMTFYIKCPVFIARQWIRHRTASINEYSARYSEMRDEFYRPTDLCQQSMNNKQGTGNKIENKNVLENFQTYLDKSEALYEDYQTCLDSGVAREQARIGLPVSVYTEFYWQINLHNLMHFLHLRRDHHAQKEIRDFANVIFDMMMQVVPDSMCAFEDYMYQSITLTRLEIEAIVHKEKQIDSTNKREQAEYKEKLEKLDLHF